jgi:uncharacterized membrane protein
MKAQPARPWKPVSRILLSSALGAVLVLLALGLTAAQGSEEVTRITVASGTDRRSLTPSLNGNGAVIAFMSDSDFLGQGILDGQDEIWLYDRRSMTYTRVTTASDGNRDSSYPYLSADGTIVAFRSDSDLLAEGIPDDVFEVWLYDTKTLTFTRVTSATDGTRDSVAQGLSADGTIVLFYSDSDFLGQGIPDEQYEVWLYDTTTASYTRVTTASDPDRDSYVASLTADGSVVAFHSSSDFLNQGITSMEQEVWLYDTTTLTFTRVTSSPDPMRHSSSAKISADGTVVAFTSYADLLDEGLPDIKASEVWLYDTASMALTRVTTASDVDRDSYVGSVSADGRLVGMHSDSDFLAEGVPNDLFEVWLYDTAKLTLTRVTSATDGMRDSRSARLSADSTTLVFNSDCDFLNEGIVPGQHEIWVTQLMRPVYLPLVLRVSQ